MKKKVASKKAVAKKRARKVPVSRGNQSAEERYDKNGGENVRAAAAQFDELTSLRMENEELRKALIRLNGPRPHPERVQMTPEEGHIVFSGPKAIGDRVLKFSKGIQIEECMKDLKIQLVHARNECTRLEAEIEVHATVLSSGAY